MKEALYLIFAGVFGYAMGAFGDDMGWPMWVSGVIAVFIVVMVGALVL